MIRTERLTIYPASREQMEAMIASEQEEELKEAYTEMLEGCLRRPDQWDWYAMWMIDLNVRGIMFRMSEGISTKPYTVKKEDDLHMSMQIIFLFVANPASQMP